MDPLQFEPTLVGRTRKACSRSPAPALRECARLRCAIALSCFSGLRSRTTVRGKESRNYARLQANFCGHITSGRGQARAHEKPQHKRPQPPLRSHRLEVGRKPRWRAR
jgi:hypothetical protein